MPPYPSDNLYSMDDDDQSVSGESFSDELTPTDGYFNRPGMSTNRLVPDPSIDYGPPEAKTLIDPASSQVPSGSSASRLPLHPRSPSLASSPPYVSPGPSRSQTMSPTQYTPVSPVSSRRREPSFSEHEPLIYQPPPAYSESPPPPTVDPAGSFRGSYSTVPEQHLERGFLQNRVPESMGGPVDDDHSTEGTPLVGIRRFSPRRRKIKALLFVGIVLAVIGTTASIVLGCSKPPRGKPIDADAEYCPDATIKRDTRTYEFSSGKELSIVHKTKDNSITSSSSSISSEGEIRLRKTPKDSKHGNTPYITVELGTSIKMDIALEWSQDSQTLQLTTPRYAERYYTRPQCLYAIITAFFPEDTEITNLRLDSPTLHLALADIKVNVTGRSQFTTSSGSIWLPTVQDVDPEITIQSNGQHVALSSRPKHEVDKTDDSGVVFSSRRTVVETTSGQITGTYPLLDELLMSSQSGQITVAVVTKPASKSSPAPADLEVQTASGSIQVDMLPTNSSESVVERDYITRVHSTGGSISGKYYLGSESNFKTTSGSIDIVALPVLPAGDATSKIPPNTFETHTLSGQTKISVLDPIFLFPSVPTIPLQLESGDPYEAISRQISELDPPSGKLRTLRSSHSSNTGQITASYPDAWQGSVHAKTVSGEIKVRGEGFRTVKEKNGVAYKEVLKRRGVDDKGKGSTVEMNNISGSVGLEIV